MNNNKKRFWSYFLVSSIISIANVAFCTNRPIATGLTIIEVIVLVFLLLKRDIAGFLCLFVISISNCLEFSQFVGTQEFYNMKSIRIAGINIGAWMLLIMLIFSVLKPIKIGEVKNRQFAFYKYGSLLIYMNLIALVMGAILIILNDNRDGVAA